jgi:hypothetical protein
MPLPLSLTAMTMDCGASPCEASRFAVEMTSMPPSGMASRAFAARFNTAISNPTGSILAGGRSFSSS